MYSHVDTYRWHKLGQGDEMEFKHAPLLKSHKSLGVEVNLMGDGVGNLSQCSLPSKQIPTCIMMYVVTNLMVESLDPVTTTFSSYCRQSTEPV